MMFNLIVYGSLLDFGERSKQGLEELDATPVMVKGFRRSFSQTPTWRKDTEGLRSVLSVEDHEGSQFNAILLAGLTTSTLAVVDEREKGYTRTSINRGSISPFMKKDIDWAENETFLYCGKKEKRDTSLLPNLSYLNICLRGARTSGHSFEEFFMASTFVGELSVKVFLQKNSSQ